MGNHLANNFTPRERLHLYQSQASTVNICFSHSSGTGTSDGTTVGIIASKDFRIVQLDTANTDTWTLNATFSGSLQRFRIWTQGANCGTCILLKTNSDWIKCVVLALKDD